MSLREKSKMHDSFEQLHSSIISTTAPEFIIDTSTSNGDKNDDVSPRRGSMSPRASIPFPYKPSQHRQRDRELPSQEQQQEQPAMAIRESVHPLDEFSLWFHVGTVVKLSWRLSTLLVHGTSIWMIKMVRLLCFVVALFPAFVVFGGFYFVTSDRMVVPYLPDTPHRTSRHYLDIYGSSSTLTSGKKKPVVVFLTGGAWVIGYKMWGALMARTLVPFGILLVIPDYRNFPQTNIEGMIDDADRAIEWTLQNIHKYGGDPNSLVIAGQSAGAHIGACLLLAKAQLEAPVGHYKAASTQDFTATTTNNKTTNGTTTSNTNSNRTTTTTTTTTTTAATTWHALHIRGFLCVSGPYDLVAMRDILHKNGLDKSIVNAMFCNHVAQYSPTLMARELAASASVSANKNDNNKTNTSAPNTIHNHNHNHNQSNHVQNGSHNDNDPSHEETVVSLLLVRVRKHFPATCVIHGEADKTVPFQMSLEFFEALKELQLEESVEFRLYPSWSHTDPILEAPFAGNHLFHQDVYNLVKRWTIETATATTTPTLGTTTSTQDEGADIQQDDEDDDCNGPLELLPFDESHEACQKICPLFLVQIARACNPF